MDHPSIFASGLLAQRKTLDKGRSTGEMITERHVEDDVVLTCYLDKAVSIVQTFEADNLDLVTKRSVELCNSFLASNETRNISVFDRCMFAAKQLVEHTAPNVSCDAGKQNPFPSHDWKIRQRDTSTRYRR